MRSCVHAVRCYPRRPVFPIPPTVSHHIVRLEPFRYNALYTDPSEGTSFDSNLALKAARARAFTPTLLDLRRPFMRQLGRLHAYN
jgi:hypothetical protein